MKNFDGAVAITGIGCRFPGGVVSPESYWRFLCEAGDGITQTPAERWDLAAYYNKEKGLKGKVYTKKGGFLENIDQFDPQFFGIAPREADFMDPQQRLLLEVTWEAFEDCGLVPAGLAGSNVGVFVGLFIHDYENIHNNPIEHKLSGIHSATGGAVSIAANRISHVFDFRGPSMAVDTACSSSLVAVHLACESLLNNESKLAVAGGVNAILKPEVTMSLCQAAMLSPDGYCKSFDADADGYTRAEGAAMVVLKRLTDALRDNDPVYAVIRGSAVNHDGRGEGLTFPNEDSQRAVLQNALDRAGIPPHEVQYVEAHGTGTPAGDPVEANALGKVLRRERSADKPCIVGSVKSNFGHTESAAGVAGLIKAALMLKYHKIPPNLHFNRPNPQIPFEDLKLRVPTSLEPWNKNGCKSRIACINSFGFGGANAHTVLEELTDEYPAPRKAADSTGEKTNLFLVPLSAHTPEALKAAAKSWREFTTTEKVAESIDLADIGRTASMHRARHFYRLAVVSGSKEGFAEHLKAFLSGEKLKAISTGTAAKKPSKLAFIFSGMGQQWRQMGKELLETEPLFRESIHVCDEEFKKYTADWSLTEELTADEGKSRIDETRITQPCIFSLQVGLAALYRSWGVVPEMVLGHSVGEIAAAHVAGILDIRDAAFVAYHRSRLQQTVAGAGKMLAVGLSEELMRELLDSAYGDEVSIAAVNSPASVTVSGDGKALEDIEKILANEKIFARFLKVDVPYHSHVMDPILPELEYVLKKINPKPDTIPFVSTVFGKTIDGREVNAEYWRKNVREPVKFFAGFDELLQEHCDLFIEIGAHPVLATSMRESAGESGKNATILSSLRRKESCRAMLLNTMGKLFCIGYPVQWELLYGDKGRFVKLPFYPFQRERYWNESEESIQIRTGKRRPDGGSLTGQNVHHLLGGRMASAVVAWNGVIDLKNLPYLEDHVVQDAVVCPAAAYVEMGLAAAREIYGNVPCLLETVEMKSPLVLDADRPTTLQLTVEQTGSFSIYGRPFDDEGGRWIKHACGNMEKPDIEKTDASAIPISEIQQRCPHKVSKETIYNRLLSVGLKYGTDFQSIEYVLSNETEAIGRLQATADVGSGLDDYRLHPALLDACFQMMASFSPKETYLPVRMDKLLFYKQVGVESWSHVILTEAQPDRVKGDITILDNSGNPVAKITGLLCRRINDGRNARIDSLENMLYEYEWKLQERPGASVLRNSHFLPSPEVISEKLEPEIPKLVSKYARGDYYDMVEPEMDALVGEYIIGTMNALGWNPKTDEQFTPEELAGQFGVAPELFEFFTGLLDILARQGFLQKTDDKWCVTRKTTGAEPQKTWNRLILEHPAYHAELTLTQRCGFRLKEVLLGETDPFSLVFPQGSPLMEHLYKDSPTFRIYNRIVRQIIACIIQLLPEGQTLRILETGTGAGAMTSRLLPLLPENRVEYVLTGMPDTHDKSMKQKFRDVGFIDRRVLDITEDPLKQGFQGDYFDLIIKSDAIHDPTDSHSTLNNLNPLLASGGIIIMLEPSKRPMWFDLVFGMLTKPRRADESGLHPAHTPPAEQLRADVLEKTEFEFTEISDRGESMYNVVALRRQKAREIPGVHWQKHRETLISETDLQRPWLIFADDGNVAADLESELKRKKIEPVMIEKGDDYKRISPRRFIIRPESKDDMRRLLGDATGALDLSPVLVDMWYFDDFTKTITSDFLKKRTNEHCVHILYAIQELTRHEWKEPPWLWLLTNGTQTVGGCKTISMAQTPIWGLGRSVVAEHANIRTRMLDVSPAPCRDEMVALCEELLLKDVEDEITLRREKRYIRRMVRKKPDFETCRPPVESFCLEGTGTLRDLKFTETPRSEPDADEVEIRVCATGLNFKDVLKIKGILENESISQDIGMECSGVITRTGKNARGFGVGDEVFGFVTQGFSNYIRANPMFLAHKPGDMSLEEAATIPVTFVSSYYALHELARIRKGERVLIHTATGGLGLAAIKVARAAGAKVFSTAGNPEKRDFLRAMGVEYVGDSRKLEFADEIMHVTEHEGVDVVINTLPGKAIAKSIALLKPVTGRFVDVANFYSETAFQLSALKPIFTTCEMNYCHNILI